MDTVEKIAPCVIVCECLSSDGGWSHVVDDPDAQNYYG